MLACVACVALMWPHHAKPMQTPQQAIVAVEIGQAEADQDLGELVAMRDTYPWLKPWAQPALDLIANIEVPGKDEDVDSDLAQLRLIMWKLRNMEQNDTI